MKKIFFAFLVGLIALTKVSAQQDPHYTQYMYNMNVINPAYAGSKENLAVGLLFRKQWVQLEDSPTTFTATGHSPVGKNVGIGLSFISDRIGPVKESNITSDFSYTLNLGGENRLAFGLKAGFSLLQIDYATEIAPTLQNINDPLFGANSSRTNLNIGTGVFYYTNKYYLALSVPNMLNAVHLDFNGKKYGSDVQHYFVTGGYVFDLNPNLKFKPFFLVKSAFNAPTSFDISTNFLMFDKLELGASYRYQDAISGLVNFKISDGLRIGYAYDHVISDISKVSPSSHEIFLLFDLNFPKKVTSSPRYF